MLRPTVGAAESLFNLGGRYLDQTPEQTPQLVQVEQMLTISRTLLCICGSAQYDDARP